MVLLSAHAVVAAAPEQLRRTCALSEIPFADTTVVEPQSGPFEQPRALEALAVAASMPAGSGHVFATGPAGTGIRTMLGDWLRGRAAQRPTPPDLLSLHRFDEPLRPLTVAVPAGRGKVLAAEVDTLVGDARRALVRAFDSESFRKRHRALHDEAEQSRGEILGSLDERARRAGVHLELTPAGVLTVPIVAGRPLQPDELQAIPDAVRERYEAAVAELGDPVDAAFAAARGVEREIDERHQQLMHEVATFAIGHLFAAARRAWSDVPRIAEWLDAARDDIINNLEAFRLLDEGEGEGEGPPVRAADVRRMAMTARYVVNVLVSHEPDEPAPVIIATDPSFYDLFGRVEYETSFGVATTDHRHLRAGILHRASGGFLVLQATDLLTTPLAWARLKQALRTQQLKIENVAVQYMLFPGVTLDPEPAALDVTVVLVGPVELYELLLRLDEDVARLFKLRADFADELPREAATIAAYAGLLARLARERELLPFDASAIAAVVEHGGRLAGHRDRLTARTRDLSDLAAEAAQLAVERDASAVSASHVTAAADAHRRRSDLVEEQVRRATLEGTRHIDLDGAVVGQVNGLAVGEVGGHAFGHPIRITATVAPGQGDVVDIDREARLSGPVHAKGVLILSGFLAGRYCADRPMGLRASIVFEQSYGPVEGDSASTAELLALLSALAGLPADQGVAVTGAVDQHGAVHAVGGINEKVEGFFDLCAERGLTGRQGVVVPAANLPHLMLEPRVVDAARDGRFAIWPVRTIDEALALVTGGERADALVRDRLARLSAAARDADTAADGHRGRGR